MFNVETSKEKICYVVKLYNDGNDISNIAKIVGISVKKVEQILRMLSFNLA